MARRSPPCHEWVKTVGHSFRCAHCPASCVRGADGKIEHYDSGYAVPPSLHKPHSKDTDK